MTEEGHAPAILELVHNRTICSNIDFKTLVGVNDHPALIVHQNQLKNLNPNHAYLISPYFSNWDTLLAELRQKQIPVKKKGFFQSLGEKWKPPKLVNELLKKNEKDLPPIDKDEKKKIQREMELKIAEQI